MILSKSFRSIIEAYCSQCDRVWTGRNAGVIGRAHAEHSGHQVRVTRTIVLVYNQGDGKEKVAK